MALKFLSPDKISLQTPELCLKLNISTQSPLSERDNVIFPMALGQNHEIIQLLLFCASHPIWGLSLSGSALKEHLTLASAQQVHGRHPGRASIPLLVTTWPLSLPTLLHPSILNVVVSDSVKV